MTPRCSGYRAGFGDGQVGITYAIGVLGDAQVSGLSSCSPQERAGRLGWGASRFSLSTLSLRCRGHGTGEGRTSRDLMGQSELTGKPARARPFTGRKTHPEARSQSET